MSNLSSRSPEEPQIQSSTMETRYHHIQSSLTRSLRYLDIAAAILRAIATVATAWCAYQSTRWSGVQATAFATAPPLRIQSNTAFNAGLAAVGYDTAAFIEWFNARSA